MLVVVLVLGALGFRDRKETDVLQLTCSVSLIAKQSGFSRTSTTRTTLQIRTLRVATRACAIRRRTSKDGQKELFQERAAALPSGEETLAGPVVRDTSCVPPNRSGGEMADTYV